MHLNAHVRNMLRIVERTRDALQVMNRELRIRLCESKEGYGEGWYSIEGFRSQVEGIFDREEEKSKQKQKISATRLEQRRLAAELYLRHWGQKGQIAKGYRAI
jgi:hypothetical protein